MRQVRFHDLRHTFASLLLQSPVYVKDQMGHCSIQVTVDLYGHLIPGGNKQAVDWLDFGVEERSVRPESATPRNRPLCFRGRCLRIGCISSSYEEGNWGG